MADLGIKTLGAVPDCIKLAVIQRRHAGRGLFQKALVGFFRIAVFLNDDTGKAGHGSVTASFRDHDIFLVTAGQVCIELVVIQKFRSCAKAVERQKNK